MQASKTTRSTSWLLLPRTPNGYREERTTLKAPKGRHESKVKHWLCYLQMSGSYRAIVNKSRRIRGQDFSWRTIMALDDELFQEFLLWFIASVYKLIYVLCICHTKFLNAVQFLSFGQHPQGGEQEKGGERISFPCVEITPSGWVELI